MDIVGTVLTKGYARFTFIAWFRICREVKAIDCLGKNTGGGGLPYSPRTTKQIGMSQVIAPDRIFKRRSNSRLANYRSEGIWAIFAG